MRHSSSAILAASRAREKHWFAAVGKPNILAVLLLLAGWGRLSAQTQPPPIPTPPSSSAQQTPAPGQPKRPSVVITLDQAIEFARQNNASLQAQRTLISQDREQEVTANLRPNPTLSLDTQYLPLFSPSLWSTDYVNTVTQFDVGIGYLFERGKKRQHRLQAAKDATAVTESQTLDLERTTIANTAEQFIAALLAKSNLEFAEGLLASYQHTVGISQEQEKAGAMSKADLLKIQLQTLQFQTDVTSAKIALVQALNTLRSLIGFDSVPRDFDVTGQLQYQPMNLTLDELRERALHLRPDLQAAERGITAAQSQIGLAKANAKQDLTVTFDYTHLNSANLGAFYFDIPLPIFNRNQGEVARTYFALTQAKFQDKAAEEQVLTDVKNGFETLLNNRDVVELYDKGYIQKAQQSLEIAQFAYRQGAASLLDFLDAERSYRSTELNYRQALATYMTSLEQLREAVGTRNLP
jgi:cobalt-zinc-cadmium efflux system outer membrane protein